jgi:cysteine/O-acetylserine efflux protein
MTVTLPLISYILVTTFTPGPNNLTATTAGLSLGFRRSLPFLWGITLGFFIVMFASAAFNLFLQSRYGALALYLKWIGFAYMLWLCASLFIRKQKAGGTTQNYSFMNGALLQLVNPKVILYGVTLYGMFFGNLLGSRLEMLLSALALSGVGLVSVLAWCLAGSAFNRRLGDRKTSLVFNLVLAALLLYSAFSIVLA